DAAPENLLSAWLKPWKAQKEQITELVEAGGQVFIQMEFARGQFSKARILLSKDKSQIESLVLYFRQPLQKEKGGLGKPPRLEVRIQHLNLDADPEAEYFALSHYLVKTAGKYAPAPRLSDYTLTN
ncbi:MAG: hypothetical protein AAF570_18525, partial [Bacteroidota bacterium]